jgi:hypothetical protein
MRWIIRYPSRERTCRAGRNDDFVHRHLSLEDAVVVASLCPAPLHGGRYFAKYVSRLEKIIVWCGHFRPTQWSPSNMLLRYMFEQLLPHRLFI